MQDDSLRLRLAPAEVARLAHGETVESQTPIAPGTVLAVVLRVADVRQPGAELDDATLTITVPRVEAAVWAEDEREGLYGQQDAGDGRTLQIAVEKDYPCGHRESPADTFPHPDARPR